MSSCGSASSVAEEAESRDQSAASSSSIDAGRKQPPKVAPKNGVKGKDSPWIMRPGTVAPVDVRLDNLRVTVEPQNNNF